MFFFVDNNSRKLVKYLNTWIVMESSFTMESCVRGHHAYQNVRTPAINETLVCKREPGNIYDPYAVAVYTGSAAIVGHVPRIISAACSMFLLRGGSIECTVIGARRYSADLPQGGLELPCVLKFQGSSDRVAKLMSVLDKAPRQLKQSSLSNLVENHPVRSLDFHH